MKTWLFISGLGSSHAWSQLLISTAGHHDVVALKLPGMAADIPPQWRETTLLEALIAQMDAVEGQLVLVGHSYGSRLALLLAERHPRVESVVLLAPVLGPLPFLRACRIFFMNVLGRGWASKEPTSVFFTEEEYSEVRHLTVEGLSWRGLISQLLVAVPRLLSPVRHSPRLKLIIWGAKDRIVAPRPHEDTSSHIVQDGGHYWWVSRPDVWKLIKEKT